MQKLDLQTPDFTSANIARLLELFPNCRTETKLPDGTLKPAIDFDLLRQELAYDLVEGPQERYRLDWPGKREALALANKPIRKTLRPSREESVDFDHTKNLYIEGDNLDALKLVQESYLGQVKMIYIDPPYNTGNDFIYDDDFSMSRSDYQEISGEVDEEGLAMFDEDKWKQNSSGNGRFHSEWLSMIYPRLKLARNILHDEGVIFISIDDAEGANLKRICDEVFGESNFIANGVWSRKRGKDNSAKFLSRNHEYFIVYAKSVESLTFGRLKISAETRKAYRNPDTDSRGDYRLQGIWARGTQGGSRFAFNSKSGSNFSERLWLVGEKTMKELDHDNRLTFVGDNVYKKLFLSEHKGDIPETIWLDASNAANAADEIKDIFGKQLFDTVKPIPYLMRMMRLGANGPNDIILDFFSGSATTAHAVMLLNAEDGGQRRHIMVQLPEPCDEKSEAFKAGYKTIAEIGKERIRRAGAKIRKELEEKLAKELPGSEEHESLKTRLASLDIGFRVLKVDSSNMADVYYQPDELTQEDLSLHVDNLKRGRNSEDLLFQVLLDWGVDLSLPVMRETFTIGKTDKAKGEKHEVFFVAGNAVAACFDLNVSEELVKELAKRTPLRAVFRDAGYASDSAKINIEQIFKALSPHTELKTL